MVKISSLEVYSDRYGTQVPHSNVSYPESFQDAPIDYYSYSSEDLGLGSLQQGQVQDRPSDQDLVSNDGLDLQGFNDDPMASFGKDVSALRAEIEDVQQSPGISDEDRKKFLDRVTALDQKLLSGNVPSDSLQGEIDTLRNDWETAVDQASQNPPDANAPTLSKPRTVDERTHTATYDANPDVTVQANYDDNVRTSEITAATVTLKGATLNDSFVVTFDEDSKSYVIVAEGQDKKGRSASEEFHVSDSQLTSLTLASGNVDVSALSDEQLAKLHLGLDPKPAREVVPVEWPEKGIADLISMKGANSTTSEDDNSDYAVRLAQQIDDAVAGKKNWDDVKSFITTWYGHGGIGGDGVTGYNAEKCLDDENYMNDVIRKVVTAIYHASKATSDDDPRFMKMMAKIPQDVRLVLKDWVTKETGELGEKQGGDLWDSGETADRIQASIDYENGKEDTKKSDAPAPASGATGDTTNNTTQNQ